jgi:hypothetical protein
MNKFNEVINIDKMPKFLKFSNMTLDEITKKIDDPDLTQDEFEYCIRALEFVKRKVENAFEDYMEFNNQTTPIQENRIINFSKILQEGGKRKNMPQSTIDSFIHQLLLIPADKKGNKDENISRRQEIVNEIFEAIAEKNREAWLKSAGQ